MTALLRRHQERQVQGVLSQVQSRVAQQVAAPVA
jgi:hypothetical protein